jgi:hypothetical protein
VLHHKKSQSPDAGQQIILIAVTIAACVIAGILGAPDKWLSAIYVTMVTFPGMIFFFRDRWSSKGFWIVIISAFLVHLPLVWLIFGVVLRRRDDIGLLVCLPPIFLECFLLYHAVRFFAGKSAS